jgi:hypothetical protein
MAAEADGAFGARVEIMLRAAENNDAPTAIGILAGMSDEQRAKLTTMAGEQGDLLNNLLALVPGKGTPTRRRILPEPRRRTVFGNAALADAEKTVARATS